MSDPTLDAAERAQAAETPSGAFPTACADEKSAPIQKLRISPLDALHLLEISQIGNLILAYGAFVVIKSTFRAVMFSPVLTLLVILVSLVASMGLLLISLFDSTPSWYSQLIWGPEETWISMDDHRRELERRRVLIRSLYEAFTEHLQSSINTISEYKICINVMMWIIFVLRTRELELERENERLRSDATAREAQIAYERRHWLSQTRQLVDQFSEASQSHITAFEAAYVEISATYAEQATGPA